MKMTHKLTPKMAELINSSIRVSLSSVLCVGILSCSNTEPKLWARDPVTNPKDQNETSEKGTVIADKPAVDILFVIDDSGSMGTHQKNLAANISGFVSQFLTNSSLDYHIGVITSSTDLGGGWTANKNGILIGNPAYIDNSTVNALSLLTQRMVVGTDGSGYERFFTPVQMALTNPNLSGPNKGFYRPNAYLALVFITDAEDQSSELPTADFIDFLKDLKPGRPDKILSYGVIVPSAAPSGSCERDDYLTPVRIEEYLTAFNGQSFGLCDPAYGQKLSDMGKNLADKVSRLLLLGRKPKVDTIKVVFGTQVILRDPDTGWLYDDSRVAITFGPHLVWTQQPQGTQIQVSFKPDNVLPEDQTGN